jgi:HPt (histidine-containing phosphotransfer) domain-containing protein
MKNMEESSQLDRDLLEDYVQSLGNSIVKKMFDLYAHQVVLYLDDIEASLLCDNSKQWQEYCHKMKGAAGSVGLKALYFRLKRMETTTANVNDKVHQLAQLKIHNNQAMSDFRDWLAGI